VKPNPGERSRARPSAALGWITCAAVVGIWGVIRLAVFPDIILPLSYTVPLLLALWTRDKRMLWSMAGAFAIFATVKVWWVLPEPALAPWARWATYLVTELSIFVAAAILRAVLDLRVRLEQRHRELAEANAELEATNEELAAREEEIALQNEELSRQNEELRVQGEELEQQSEELGNQTERLQASNDELAHREEILQAMLSAQYALADEADALHRVCLDGLALIGGGACGVRVTEARPDGMHVQAHVGLSASADADLAVPLDRSLAGLVVREGRTASLDDLSLRPDFLFATPVGNRPFRSVLAAPLAAEAKVTGAVEFYSTEPGPWTQDAFRLAEWVALLIGAILERSQLRAGLRESDLRLRQFFDAAQDGLLLYELATGPAGARLVQANPAACAMFGYEAPELILRSPSICDAALVSPAGAEGGRLFQTTITRSDGRSFEAEVNAAAFRYNRASYVLCSVRDVSERMRSERALRDNLQSKRVALDAAQLGAWTYTFDGDLWELDERAQEHYGTGALATHDRETVLRIMPEPADREAMWLALERACDPAGDGHYEVQYRIRKKDGGLRWISAWGQVEFGGSGEERRAIRLIGASRDVTEERHSQEELRESERRLRLWADAIPQLAWMAGPDGWIHWYNQQWYEYTGTTPEEMEGWGWQSVHDPDVLPSVLAEWRASIETGEPFDMTFPLRGADGEFRRFLTRIRPFKDSEGRVRQWFGTNTDVEELKRIEEKLSAARQNVERASLAKDQFLAMLSHELRTPLNPALMAATVLEKHPHLPRELHKTAGIIRRNVELEARLIDDLLDLTRVARGKLTITRRVLDGREVVGHAIRTCQSELVAAGLELERRLPSEPVYVDADPARLQQIIWNLLQNAIKFTPSGGRITVSATVETDGGLRIEVRDTGKGIAREALERIFDAFEQDGDAITQRYGGLGLGLSICRSLVALHQGTIAAFSDGPGKGSAFVVTLPPARALPPERSDAPPSSAELTTGAPRAKSRVLLVEDHADTATVTAALLESFGHHVTTAGCVRDALDECERQAFDLIVSDLGLPDGSGFELLRSLSTKRPIRAIALSGYGMESDVRKSLEAGFTEHLTKPISADLLETAVSRALAQFA